MSEETVRIGCIGAGFMGQLAHLRNFTTIEDCTVVALAEPRERLRERVAARCEIEETYPDHEALLENADVDAAVAIQHYSHHHAIVPDVLEAGLPVFTEKPLARSVESGEELARAAEDAGVPYMVGYMKRADPGMVRAKSIVDRWRDSGEYGDLRFVRMTVPHGNWTGNAEAELVTTDESPPDTMPADPLPGEFDEEAASRFDEVINYYIHQFNALRYVLGEGYDVVHADPTGSLTTIESESGLPGTLEMRPYDTTSDWQESLLVGFDNAYVRVELQPPLAHHRASDVEVMTAPPEGEQETTRPAMPNVSSMRAQAKTFCEVVRGERDPPSDARDAVEDLRIAREYVRDQFA
jgi:predicted dehydrogenase